MSIKKLLRKIAEANSLKWLSAGLGIKRWLFLIAISGFVVGVSAMGLYRHGDLAIAHHLLPLILGLLVLFYSFARVIKFIQRVTMLAQDGNLDDLFVHQRKKLFSPRITAIGGGTGLATLLRGLKQLENFNSQENLAAVVTVTDDGGSSGKLRNELNVLPPGDIRNCITALAEKEQLLTRLFQYRFPENSGLSGHSFGNLYIAALTGVTGDFAAAIRESSKVLAVKGRILPATLENVDLVATFENGLEIVGETKITSFKQSRIKKVRLEPPEARAYDEAIAAIEKANAIVIGPGSLFTSIIPNLLLSKIVEAVRNSKAIKIYICNVMTQPGETDNFTLSDHVRALEEVLGKRVLDYVIVNNGEMCPMLLEKYRREGSVPVELDTHRLEWPGPIVIKRDLVSSTDCLKHDPLKLAGTLLEIIWKEAVKYDWCEFPISTMNYRAR